MTATALRAARERLELTQQQLADELGVHRVTVAKWETGAEAIPRLAELAMEALTRRASLTAMAAVERELTTVVSACVNVNANGADRPIGPDVFSARIDRRLDP